VADLAGAAESDAHVSKDEAVEPDNASEDCGQRVASAAAESSLPPADETVVRAKAHDLQKLAGDFGISDLRFASAGRLVGHVAEDRDALDVAEFEVAARRLLGAEVGLFSERVLAHANVSSDLVGVPTAVTTTSGQMSRWPTGATGWGSARGQHEGGGTFRRFRATSGSTLE